MRDMAEQLYREAFGDEAGELVVVGAPGRVNIIGEHTDYNDGFVLPMPIDRHIWTAAKRRGDDSVHLFAADYQEGTAFDPDDVKFDDEHRWANYVLGVAKAMAQDGYNIRGADMVIWGDIPQGAGLGSSGALEMAAAKGFAELFGFEIDPIDMAYIGKSAENDFVGVRSGIMDQFASVLGRKGQALFIDCRTNDYEHIPLEPGFSVVVVNTGVRRELASSKYNERRMQCEEGVAKLRRSLGGIKALRDVTPDQFERYQHGLPQVVRNRCRHVIFENARVLEAVESMKDGDMERLGGLMYDSHASLRDLYEVSCRELDILVEAARNIDGTVGARMVGAGFGGCTVNIVREDRVQGFTEAIKEKYEKSTGLTAEVYRC